MEEKKLKYDFSNIEKFYAAIKPNTVSVVKGYVAFNATAEDNAYSNMLNDLYFKASSTH